MLMLILTIAVAGVIVSALASLPMLAPFRTAIVVIAIICLVIYLANAFGIGDLDVPRLRR